MTWYGTLAFAGYLNSINYLGHNTWLVPTTYDQTCSVPASYNCTNSMMGELFYTGLGLTAGQSIATSPLASSLFTNIQAVQYWSSTEYLLNPLGAFGFQSDSGLQGISSKDLTTYAWVAYTSPVPEPASLLLLLSGLGLMGYATKRRPTDRLSSKRIVRLCGGQAFEIP